VSVGSADVRDGPDPALAAHPIRVIFIDTGNAARSQMAEGLLRHDAGARFEVVSAGVTPRSVHPLTIAALDAIGIDSSGATSKPVGMFVGQRFDYVITLCDRARVTCPVFPGGRETLHWGLDDPTEVTGSEPEQRAAFDRVLKEIAVRLHVFRSMALSRAAR
jgi:arsenate reductase (thioredoxin)